MSSIFKRPKSLNEIINSNDELTRLYQHIEFLSSLDKTLQEFLPANLKSHCTVANLSNQTLVLHSDAAVWATRLRYLTPEILNFMRTHCNQKSLKTIRIRVNPLQQAPMVNSRQKMTLTKSSADLFKQVANSVTDENLQKSLLNIAKHYHDT